jgi:exo-1,4-beta-D-glucosaminidase
MMRIRVLRGRVPRSTSRSRSSGGLTDSARKTSTGCTWNSSRAAPDVSDFARGNGRNTPIATYADLTGLQDLPPAKVTVTSRTEPKGADQVERVTVQNPSSNPAFFVHLTVWKGKAGADVKPVIWEDNYFELMPGEKRDITATFAKKLLDGAAAQIKVDGWNVAPVAADVHL